MRILVLGATGMLGTDLRYEVVRTHIGDVKRMGAAALRYPVPGSPGAAGTHLVRVEVAWENLFEGRRGRGSIADAGPQLPGDFAKTAGPARQGREARTGSRRAAVSSSGF